MMMRWRMMLGEVVGFVETSFLPVDVELSLTDTVADPVVAHVDGFGAFLLDGVIGNAGSGGIVSGNRGWRLGVAEFFEGDSDWAGLFAVVEEGRKFSFGGARDDFADELAENVDGAVRGRGWIVRTGCFVWILRETAKKLVASDTGAGFGGRKMRGVAFDV